MGNLSVLILLTNNLLSISISCLGFRARTYLYNGLLSLRTGILATYNKTAVDP